MKMFHVEQCKTCAEEIVPRGTMENKIKKCSTWNISQFGVENMEEPLGCYEVIVIGAGHAGVEAALASGQFNLFLNSSSSCWMRAESFAFLSFFC